MSETISTMERSMQMRTELLLGRQNLEKLQQTRVLMFGLGGVGSWCAEALVRSGIRNLTIVDSDSVCTSNCNRQLMATGATIGRVKVDVLRERLLQINPDANIQALQMIYEPASADFFHMEDYDFVIDAIDSLSNKADLILRATSLPERTTLISSMGAALRTDPFKVRNAEFWDVKGDPLARAIRKKFKKQGTMPQRKFQCVYSEELPRENMGATQAGNNATQAGNNGSGNSSNSAQADSISSNAPQACSNGTQADNNGNGTQTGAQADSNSSSACTVNGADGWSASKAQVNGSICHVTAIFGMSIAGLVINTVIDQ